MKTVTKRHAVFKEKMGGNYFGRGIKKTPSDYRKRFAVIWFRKYQFYFAAGIMSIITVRL